MAARSRFRGRGPRTVAFACSAIALALSMAVAGDWARPLVRDRAVAAINASLPGKLEIEQLDGVSIFGLRARGVSLRDARGQLVAAAERVEAALRPWDLFTGTVSVSEVVVDGGFVDLGAPAEKRGGLLELLSAQSEPDEATEGDDDGLELRFERITLHRATTRAELDGEEWRVRELEAVAWVQVGAHTRFGVSRLEAHVERKGEPLAQIGRTRLRYDPAGQSYAEASVRSDPTSLSAKVRLGPERGANARALRAWVDARAVTAEALRRGGLDLSGVEGRFDARTLAVGTTERIDADLSLETEGARLDAKASAGVDGALEVYGRANAAALSDVRVAQAVAPGVRGALALELHAARSATGVYEGTASLRLASARYASGELRRLQVEARVEGRGLQPPAVAADLRATELQLGRAQLHQTRLAIGGDREGYVARGTLDSGRLDARAWPDGDAWCAAGSLAVPLDGDDLTARVASVQLRDQSFALRALTLAYRDARARIDGSLQKDERLQLRARVRVPRLSSVTAPFVSKPVAGAAELALDAHGPLQGPRVKLAAGYSADELLGIRQPALRVDLDANLPARKLVAHTSLRARGIVADLDASGALPRGAINEANLRRARGQLELRVTRLALHALKQWPELRLVPSEAVLSGRVRAEGKVSAFEVVTDLRARAQFARDEEPLLATLHGALRPDGLVLALQAEDARGPLVRSNLSLDLGTARPALDLASAQRLLLERSWQVALWLGARRIDELPLTRALAIPEGLWPARVSAEVELAHRPGEEPRGTVLARAVWDPPGRESLSPRCGELLRPKLAFNAKMEDGQLHTDLHAGSGDRTTLVASSVSHAPMDEWLRVKPIQARPVQVYVELDQLRLAQIPVVCEQATGSIDGKAKLERGLTQEVTVDLDLRGRGLRFADSPPVEAEVAARAERTRLIGSAELRAAGGTATLAAELPLDRGGFVPSVDWSAPAQASAKLRELPMAALVGPIPGLRSSGGTLDGDAAMKGSLAKPVIDGRMALHDVTLTLGELGQRFERMNGALELHGRSLVLSKTSFHDLDGRATAQGRMTWRSFDPISFAGDFDLDAKRLPIRRSGVMAARLDGRVGLQIDASPRRIEVDGTLRKGRIELTNADVSAVQALDPNPEIAFTDEPPAELEAESEPETEVRIRIDASEPFWVRREDFSALVTARLRISAQPEPPSITGTVDVQRGVVELLGQMFDIERGRIRFTGGSEVDPELDLVASRTAPGGGERVTIAAKGSVRQPELRFAIDGRSVTAGEALAAALGTRAGPSGDQRMQEELGSIATGIAGSVLTLGARRELGEWVPVLGFEQGGGETRIRAGVEADRFIPRFLRHVVVDAYVEGIVSSREQTDDGQVTAETSTGAAVLLELRFPHSLSSEAQYGPGPRWSLDLSWEP